MFYHVCMFLSQNGATPLLVASLNGHSQIAELLLSKGANVKVSMQVTDTVESSIA